MSDLVTIALITAVPSTVAAVCGVVTTLIATSAARTVKMLEKNTNSIKDELVRVTGESEHAKGKIEGADEERRKP